MEPPGPGEPTEARPRTATTTQALVLSPELSLPLLITTGSQQEIVAASAGDISLVVWAETDPYGDVDVRGVRVHKSDGAPLDATPLCIACGTGSQYAPSVASNGTDFLVTWDDMPRDQGGPSIQSVRVRGADGAVLGPARVLRDDFPANYSSAVASDGSNYLVVWKGYQFSCDRSPWGYQCGYSPRIYGARVSATDGSSIPTHLLSWGVTPDDPLHVTYGGGNYLVTLSGWNVATARVRASDGTVLDSAPRPYVAGGRYPVTAFDGSRFLVVWTTSGGELRAGRLGQDGAVLDPGGFSVGEGNAVTPANVLFDGSDYRVTWEQQGQQLARQLKGVRVKPEGRTVRESEAVLVETRYPRTDLTGGRPALAALGRGRFLLGYMQFAAPPSTALHAKLKVVEDMPPGTACTQDAQCQSGFCVDGVCCDSRCGGGSANDCQACSVAVGGAVDGTCGAVRARVVCRPSAVACDVAEVCNGTRLSCPADEPPASVPDLSGDKCEDTPCEVAHYLASLGPGSLDPSIGKSLQHKAESACLSFQSGDTHAMQVQLRALSHEVRAQAGRKLSASVANTLLAALSGLFRPNACVPSQSTAPAEPTLVSLSPAPTAQGPLVSQEISLPLSISNGDQQGVVAASAGDITLVVWSETDPYGYEDIRGVRVRKSDGALLDAIPLCIACTPAIEQAPAVASNGTDFLVTWNHMQQGPPFIKGVRVRGSDGAVLGPAHQFSPDSPAHWASAVASNGSDYLVAWHGYYLICLPVPGEPWPECGFYPTILGTRVSTADGSGGDIFALSPMNISPSGSDPLVSYGGGNYLVTWTGVAEQTSYDPNAYATRVRASDGTVLDETPLTLASNAKTPTAAFDGNRFLVAWSTLGGEIRAGRLEQTGTMPDPHNPVGAGNTLTPPNVLFDGSDYRVAWEQGQESVRRLKGVRVTREGHVANGSEFVFGDNQYPWMSSPGARTALAELGRGRFLVGYTKFTSPPTHTRRVKLKVVEDLPQGTACTQDAQCQSGFCVDGVCCDSACGGGAANDCQACGVAAGGTVDGICGAVRAEAAVVCRPSAVACDVAEVCNGTQLSCPADEPSASVPDLTCDKCRDNPCDVANYLAWLGPELLLKPIGPGLQLKADSACRSFQAGDAQATQSHLKALLNEVRAQSGKKLSTSVADTLIASIISLLGS
jgi:hypothetical protein